MPHYNPETDVRNIRLVGGLLAGVGLVQLLLTVFVALWGLLNPALINQPAFARGAAGVLLSLVMGSVTSGCGLQLSRVRLFSRSDIQAMRLAWTGLVLVLGVAALGGLWTTSVLTTLAVLLMIALLAVRGAIIRLS